LANDLDKETAGYTAVASQTANDGDGFDPIGEFTPPSTPTPTPAGSTQFQNAFTGTFDGQGNTITGIYINRPTTSGVGLFAAIAETEAEIRDVTLESVDIIGDSRVGGGAGAVGNEATIINTSVSGTVEGKRAVGGIAGAVRNGDLTEVTTDGEVYGGETGNQYVALGGVVGGIEEGTIDRCEATATVSASYGGSSPNTDQIGGLAGFAGINAEIQNSSATGTVTGENITGRAGGLVGSNDATVMDCEAAGNVDAPNAVGVGGLLGDNGADVTGSTASGSVTGERETGGLVGSNYDATIKESAATGNVSSSGTAAGGLIGRTEAESDQISLTIRRCYAAGDVDNDGGATGGLVGENFGDKVVDSYALGDVTGQTDAGGLIGNNSSGVVIVKPERSDEDVTTASSDGDGGGIHRSYAAGAVTATDSDGAEGGLVGSNTLSIEQSYWDTETTGQSDAADSPGNLPPSVTGLTTSEMQGATPTGTAGNDTMGGLAFAHDEASSTWAAVVEGEEINPTPTEDGYPILEGLAPTDQLDAQGIKEADPSGPGDFEVVAITGQTPTEVAVGESFDVQYTVENVGDETAQQGIRLELDGQQVANRPDTLTSGESVTNSFSDVTVPESVSAGETIELTIRTNNDAETTDVAVTAGDSDDGPASPAVADYANQDDVVGTEGLLDGITDWRDDAIDTTLLLDVIDAWRSGTPVS
jgi:hypothetical protein